ncbi:MAG: hypothetical protein C0467_14955 [Planctomycetaceae bacterium]|nr:hypothetical protein [Planctomycetaceae bacterium]
MTVREAILKAVPVFVAQSQRDEYALRRKLVESGIPASLAAEIVEFVPLATARALLDGMGIQFADYYIRQTSQGRVIGQKALADEPLYREGLAMADEIVRMGQDTFMAIAGWSHEYQQINIAMNSGSKPGDLRCSPPVMIANNEDRREFDDTSSGTQQKEKGWWQFWK